MSTSNEELALEALRKLLDALDYEYELECSEHDEGLCLMISSPQAKYLIGENGERLNDLQYLVNRSIQHVDEGAPRVRIDCDSYRKEMEDKLIQRAKSRAEQVRRSGNPLRMEPLNAYQRRLVHHVLAQMEDIATESEESDSRFKRIVISLKG